MGLLVMQRFLSTTVTACRPCGHGLIRSYTGKTLWQGWWGAISFFFNWFVLATNAFAWKRLSAIQSPSLSGLLITDTPRGFAEGGRPSPDATEEPPKRPSRLHRAGRVVLPGFLVLGLIGWGWDATHHDHSEVHGASVPAAMLDLEVAGASFIADDGTSTVFQTARCTGEGEAGEVASGLYTHFRCQVVYDDGYTDEVVVHVLENELFFKSTGSYQP
ncbi:MAG TPA: hypothetical protein VFV62_00985 [Gaiellaceae bacterium]|nr:hypothetical protein [Gaiellaceae bacterium]